MFALIPAARRRGDGAGKLHAPEGRPGLRGGIRAGSEVPEHIAEANGTLEPALSVGADFRIHLDDRLAEGRGVFHLPGEFAQFLHGATAILGHVFKIAFWEGTTGR